MTFTAYQGPQGTPSWTPPTRLDPGVRQSERHVEAGDGGPDGPRSGRGRIAGGACRNGPRLRKKQISTTYRFPARSRVSSATNVESLSACSNCLSQWRT